MSPVPPFMGEFSDDDWAWFQAAGTKLKIRGGEAIIHEGEPVEALFVVLRGSFSVASRQVSGMPPIKLGPGEIVGEMTYIRRNERPLSSVTALKQSIVLRIPRSALDEKIAADKGFEARFDKVVSRFVVARLYGSWVKPPPGPPPSPQDSRRVAEIIKKMLKGEFPTPDSLDNEKEKQQGGDDRKDRRTEKDKGREKDKDEDEDERKPPPE